MSTDKALRAVLRERITQPTPDEIRQVRLRARLTQKQAAMLVGSGREQTWGGYEAPVGASHHTPIPLQTWETFLLLVGQHPNWWIEKKTSTD
jgi:hypothetical protein